MNATSKTFVQSGDDQQEDPSAQQHIKIESLDSGAGTFVVIATERWAVESDDEILDLTKALRDALGVKVFPTGNDYVNGAPPPG